MSKYLQYFTDTLVFSAVEKDMLCSKNTERYLFLGWTVYTELFKLPYMEQVSAHYSSACWHGALTRVLAGSTINNNEVWRAFIVMSPLTVFVLWWATRVYHKACYDHSWITRQQTSTLFFVRSSTVLWTAGRGQCSLFFSPFSLILSNDWISGQEIIHA